MPRSARLDAPGVLYHVIIRGIERRKIFKDNRDRNNFLERLSELVPKTKTACYAWVFMPNHAHFLFRTGDVSLSSLMRRLLTGYAVSFNRRHKRHGQLFQNRYKSINYVRESKWSQSIAVGSKSFIEDIKAKLGIRAKGRQVGESGGSYHLRETQIPYNSDFAPENSDLRAENAYFWKDNP
jgi:REP element-mobilizing transposase RayT